MLPPNFDGQLQRTYRNAQYFCQQRSLRRENPVKSYLNGQTRICIAIVHFNSLKQPLCLELEKGST